MRKQTVGFAFAILVLFCAFPAAATTNATTAQDLLSGLSRTNSQADAEISVIVTFDSLRDAVSNSSVMSSPFNNPQAYAGQLSVARDSVLGSLASGDYKGTKHYKHIPQMALTVNRAGLDALLNNPLISVAKDRLHRPFLSQSVNLIYSSQTISPYDGNNEWTVAVLDTGVEKGHPFLSGKVVSEACYSGGAAPLISFCPGGVTSSTSAGSAGPCTPSLDGCDHGTHVAGIAVGNGGSFDGVANRGKLIAIQVFSRLNDPAFCFPSASCVAALSSDIIAGLDRVFDLRNTFKIAAVNLSLGFGEFPGSCDGEPEKVSIDALKNAGIATIAASGNSGSSSKISSPACISSAIAVGSTLDTSDTKSTFSNNSVMLDFYAPGESIISSVPGGGFSSVNGTSQATPHVAGAWAVIKHASPGLSVNAVENLLDRFGPFISDSGVSRRRISVRDALESIDPGSQVRDINIIPFLFPLLFDD